MYSTRPNIVLGFHGCDKSVVEKVVAENEHLHRSANNYDWLGHGVYFWENSPKRALEYAKSLKSNPGRCKSIVEDPAVIGATIDLGYCLDLLDSFFLDVLKQGYDILCGTHRVSGYPLPENTAIEKEGDLLLRRLDCAVIEAIHQFNETTAQRPYDSVRSVFFEGNALYPNAGFREKNHIQICIRNPNCIKGYFFPRTTDKRYSEP